MIKIKKLNQTCIGVNQILVRFTSQFFTEGLLNLTSNGPFTRLLISYTNSHKITLQLPIIVHSTRDKDILPYLLLQTSNISLTPSSVKSSTTTFITGGHDIGNCVVVLPSLASNTVTIYHPTISI